jgi:hypothetical protein
MSKSDNVVSVAGINLNPNIEIPTVDVIAGGLDRTVLALVMAFKKQSLTAVEIHAIARVLLGLTFDGQQTQLGVQEVFMAEARKLHESYKLNLLRASVDAEGGSDAKTV